MIKAKEILNFHLLVTVIVGLLILSDTQFCIVTDEDIIQQRMSAHQKEIGKVKNQWQVLHKAYDLEKSGNYDLAIVLFRKSITMGDQNVPRLALQQIYEKTGEYEKALEQVEWFLKGNQNEQGRAKTLEDKSRLLKKIEESKSQRKIPEHAISRFPQDQQALQKNLRSLSYDEQGRLVQSVLKDEGIEGRFKEAMQFEYQRNFKEARAVYESLVPKKEEITQKYGIDGWVMLYPALQRTSEFLQDAPKEKEALLWIQANLLNPQGQYHSSFARLESRTVAHLQKRVQEVLGNS